MKNKICTFFFIVLTISGCQYQIDSPEELGRKVFTALQENDFEEVKNLTPNIATLNEYYQFLIQKETDSSQNLVLEESEIPIILEHTHHILEKAHERLNALAQERNIQWKEAVYQSCHITKHQAYNSATVRLIFKSGNRDWMVEFEAVEINERWYLWEGLKPLGWEEIWEEPKDEEGKDIFNAPESE